MTAAAWGFAYAPPDDAVMPRTRVFGHAGDALARRMAAYAPALPMCRSNSGYMTPTFSKPPAAAPSRSSATRPHRCHRHSGVGSGLLECPRAALDRRPLGVVTLQRFECLHGSRRAAAEPIQRRGFFPLENHGHAQSLSLLLFSVPRVHRRPQDRPTDPTSLLGQKADCRRKITGSYRANSTERRMAPSGV